MHPQKLKINLLCSLSMFLMVNVMAQTEELYKDNRNGDSVMTPGTMVKPALGTVNKKQGNSNSYTPNQEIEYNLTNCPSGYSNGGSSSFRTGQRLTTSFYHNGQLMKTTKSDWLPVNESCTGVENQTVSCPSGYMGTVQQKRTVTYNTSGYNYGNWSDISNSCVVIPVTPPPQPIDPVPPTTCEEQSLPGQNWNNNFCVDAPVVAPPAKCPDSYNYCSFLRGYSDGTNQMLWGTITYSNFPICTPTDKIKGGGRVFDCPVEYDNIRSGTVPVKYDNLGDRQYPNLFNQ